jgi:hypothetical protein
MVVLMFGVSWMMNVMLPVTVVFEEECSFLTKIYCEQVWEKNEEQLEMCGIKLVP